MTNAIRPSLEDHKELQVRSFNIRSEFEQIEGIMQKLPKDHPAQIKMKNLCDAEMSLRLQLEEEAYRWFDAEVVREIYLDSKRNPEPFPYDYSCWWSAAKVCRLRGTPIEQLNQLAEQKKIMCTGTNNGWLFEPRSVMNFLDQEKR